MKFSKAFLLLLALLSLLNGMPASANPQTSSEIPTEENSREIDSNAEPIVNEIDSENGLTISETLIVGKHIRRSLVHLPKDYKSNKGLPLVIILHGARLSGWIAQSVTGFDRMANEEGFVVAYPDALNKQWDDGRQEGVTPSFGVNDVKFISVLIDYLVMKYQVNPEKVYVAGYSSGGMLAQKLGMELTDKVAAVAEVAASLPTSQLKANKKPSKPISILMINGTADAAFPWEGGTTSILRINVGEVAPIMDMFQYWVNANEGPGAIPNQSDTQLNKKNGTTVDVFNTRTENGRCVMLYKIKGGGHTWPGSEVALRYIPFLGRESKELKASELIWQFFKHNENDCQAI